MGLVPLVHKAFKDWLGRPVLQELVQRVPRDPKGSRGRRVLPAQQESDLLARLARPEPQDLKDLLVL